VKSLHPRGVQHIHARCDVLRAGLCPGGLCEHWIGYGGAERVGTTNAPTEGRCRLVDQCGASICRRDPDRPPSAHPRLDANGDPLLDWFGPGYDQWNFWYFPSDTEYRDWHFGDVYWDRQDWRKHRYQRRKAWKRRGDKRHGVAPDCSPRL